MDRKPENDTVRISRLRFPIFYSLLLLPPLALAACGGDTTASHTGTGPVVTHTLAYVADECRQRGADYYEHGALVIRQGDRDPVTVAEIPEIGPVQVGGGYCRSVGRTRFGDSENRGGFTRLGVSPDGSTVVFEESDAFSAVFENFLTAEQKGLFVVHADGTGLRRLAPPSRQPPFNENRQFIDQFIAFSPDGRVIAFADKGPSPAGDEATQLVTVDLATGTRTQLTHFAPAQPTTTLPPVFGAVFQDNETIAFFTNVTGLVPYTVKTDGSDLKTTPPPVAASNAQIVLQFAITGPHPTAFTGRVSGQAMGPTAFPFLPVIEVFALDGTNLVQLTNFGRADTGVEGTSVSLDDDHVFFDASADPFGTNPTNNCQLFSVDRLGTDLRQLTNFTTGGPSQIGCIFDQNTNGCAVSGVIQDATSETLVFSTGCNPLGMNPNGAQIFAMRPDGSGLRQLTALHGLFTDADGTVHAELPGPWTYGPYSRPFTF